MTLPDGYDTILDDTVTLSAGQKQLLTNARATCGAMHRFWFWMRRLLLLTHGQRNWSKKPWTVWWKDAHPLSVPTACQPSEMQTWSWSWKMEISSSKATEDKLTNKKWRKLMDSFLSNHVILIPTSNQSDQILKKEHYQLCLQAGCGVIRLSLSHMGGKFHANIQNLRHKLNIIQKLLLW